MLKLLISLATGALLVGSPALASHILHLNIPFPSRGACEAERASLSNGDDILIDKYPELFSSEGEVRSFLNRAFTCEQHADGQWYITDHRQEVLDSIWFQRRL